jgi:hypothetical protein
MKKLIFIAFLSFTSIILPASNACERLNKPNQTGQEWKSEDKIKFIAIVNNEKMVRCDSKYISEYDIKETYGIYGIGFNKQTYNMLCI